MKKTKLLLIFCMSLFIVGICTSVFATSTQDYVTTTTINGVTVKWEYKLNDSNQIIDLKCLNPLELKGSITIPSTLEGKTVYSLADEAFKQANNVTEIILSSSVKEIGDSAFENCTALAKVSLGSVEKIRAGAFEGCTALTSIKIPKTLKEGPTIIDKYVFKNCTNLTAITLEEGLEVIPTRVLAGTNITDIKIPASVKKIDSEAFIQCKLLKNVDLGSVEEIGAGAFEGCTALTSIKIPKTLKEGPTIIDKYVFKNCTNLTAITLEEGLEVIPTRVLAGTNITDIKIPASVKKIDSEAFIQCKLLKNVDLGSVEEIGAGAFEGCTALTSIKIPKTLKEGPTIIDKYVFKNCTNLTAITLEEGLEVIPTRVLAGTNIAEIKIPASVKNINEDAFLNCTKLTKIEIYDGVKDIYGLNRKEDNVFTNHNENLTIYCYKDSIAAQYAIKHNIKYVYLTKNEEIKNNNTTNNIASKNNTISNNSNTANTVKDTTIKGGVLPKTGIGFGLIITIITLVGGGIFTYFKYNNLKDIK